MNTKLTSNSFVFNGSTFTNVKDVGKLTPSGISCWNNTDKLGAHLRVLVVDVSSITTPGRYPATYWDFMIPNSRKTEAVKLWETFVSTIRELDKAGASALVKATAKAIEMLWIEHEKEQETIAASRKPVKGIPEVIFGDKPEPTPEPEQPLLNDDEIPF